MPKWAMVIDLNRCIGCRTCMVACKIHNSVPPGMWWHRVETIGSKDHQFPTGEFPHFSEVFLPVLCNHCDNAPCVRVCPVGATYKGDDGVVNIDYERCIGCRYCMTACPYGVRQFNWQDPKKSFEDVYRAGGVQDPVQAAADDSHGYPLDYRSSDGRLLFTPVRPRGVVEKCTLCVEYVNQGLAPACVRSCTGNARIFGDLSNPFSQISEVVRSQGVFRLQENLDTKPRVYYIPADSKRGKGDVSYNPEI